jgi:hypothetical protein
MGEGIEKSGFGVWSGAAADPASFLGRSGRLHLRREEKATAVPLLLTNAVATAQIFASAS